MLRQAYSPAVRHALQAEIDKDWVKMPIDEIETRLLLMQLNSSSSSSA